MRNEKITFMELIEKILEKENKPLSSKEIWRSAQENPDILNALNSQGQTPDATIYTVILRELKSKDSKFKKVGEYPLRVILQSSKNKITDREAREESQKQDTHEQDRVSKEADKLLEKDLHLLLSFFIFNSLNAQPKSINHNKSGKDKKGANKWLHPDMVACHFIMDSWENKTAELGKRVNLIPVKLFSFEIKRELTFANLRESFFQALSNSSWANEGYLVASKIDSDEEFRGYLGRMSASFGIGIIELNLVNPDTSKILYPAKVNDNLDWEMINILIGKNPNFEEFIESVNSDRLKNFDPIPSLDDLKAIK